MNYVYKQKIFYFRLIKITTISIVSILLLFELYSCSLKKVNGELTIKVTKVGMVKPSSKFIFIYPNTYNLSLNYKAILNKISQQLAIFGFCEVKDIKQANYAFVVVLDNTFYNNKPNIESYNCNNSVLNSHTFLNLYDIREIFKKHDTLFLEVYLINSNSNYTKVMEGYTIKTVKNPTVSEKDDKGYVGFVMCSIDALFSEQSVLNNYDYQEYYFKCY